MSFISFLNHFEVMRNLHVVFTMNPSGEGLRERSSTSPALFNRCVLNWFGDWTDSALYQVFYGTIPYKLFVSTMTLISAKFLFENVGWYGIDKYA